MTTKLLLSVGIAGLMVAIGPGIGVAGNPGDISGRWVDGLLLLGATVRIAPALAPIAMRGGRFQDRSAAGVAAPTPAVLAHTARQRERYRTGSVPAGYDQRPDVPEPPLRRGAPLQVGAPIAYV